MGKRARGKTAVRGAEGGVATPSRSADDAHGALSAGLYVVATPIGNAGDITVRALQVLRRADAIACEDTRVTARLLALHGIARPLTAYHDHNAAAAGPALVARLAAGERIALVTDAGTPLVSDPGYRLVQACADAGIAVVPIPGPSAVMAALSVAGLPTDRFLFAGFLPPRPAARRRALADLAGVGATLVVMEAPHRLAASLRDLAHILGPRQAAVARELTKLFEDVRRGPLPDLARAYAEQDRVRGEVTIVVAPPSKSTAPADVDLDALLDVELASGSVRLAATKVAAATGLPRRAVYARAVELSARRR